MHGKAYLIGAGPGDPRLFTLRGVEALGEADVVLVDDLVSAELLRYAKSGARVVHVGKRCGGRVVPQAVTTRLLVMNVRRGAVVARLKGGDPFVFGRGGEEALALARAGLSFEIVPGVSSPLGAAACAGIPLTCRGVASSVAFVTAQRDGGREPSLRALAHVDTLVVFMCTRTIHLVARELLECGRADSTPVALVRGATLDAQETYVGSLRDLAELPRDWHERTPGNLWRSGVGSGDAPTLAIVGDVAGFARELAWRGAPSSIASIAAPLFAVGF